MADTGLEFETIGIPDLRQFPKLGQIHGVPVVELQLLPLQRPGLHELDWEAVLGGPKGGQDSRLFLDAPTLERLLEFARASLSGRVQIDMVGVKIRQWIAPGGHRYQTWTFVSIPPKPEHTAADELMGRV